MSQHIHYGKVAVIYGGLGAEREVSLNSGKRVLAALQSQGIDAHGVDADSQLLNTLQQARYDRAFIVVHGTGGEDGRLQGALEWMGVPYTGSGVLGSALSMDKLRCKHIWSALDLPTPAFVILASTADCGLAVNELGLPLIVKPAREGSSVGMSKVTVAAEIESAYRLAREYDHCVIAERWVGHGEYTVSLLGEQVLPAIKIETPRAFYDYAAKYTEDTTRYLIPCGLDEGSEAELGELAALAFRAIGGEGWGRVDAMRDADGSFHLIDVNTVPGMTDHSLVPMAAKARGISFEELCGRILDTSFINRAATTGGAT